MSRTLWLLIILMLPLTLHAQKSKDVLSRRFLHLAFRQPDSWFSGEEALAIGDSVLKYQQPNGGWIKNQEWHRGADLTEIENCISTGIGTTIDNGATFAEIEFLRRLYLATNAPRYRNAFLRGVFYVLNAQYDNGGWPQFYPLKKGYYTHITFNDDAMVNAMYLMKGIGKNQAKYAVLELDEELRNRCFKAYMKGLDCILKCQIMKDGKLTVWCQQHDETTFAPASARAYELASFCGYGESENILRLLMEEEEPTKDILNAINGAKEWFREHAIKNTIVEHFVNKEGKPDIRLKKKKGAPLLWARFYDLKTGKPFYCDRNGKPQEDLSDIDYERRMGYSWISTSPSRFLE